MRRDDGLGFLIKSAARCAATKVPHNWKSNDCGGTNEEYDSKFGGRDARDLLKNLNGDTANVEGTQQAKKHFGISRLDLQDDSVIWNLFSGSYANVDLGSAAS